MSKQVEFDEIDFEAIEYRNEYRHTKAVFTFLTAQALLAPSVLKLLYEGDRWESLFGGAYLGFFALIVAVFFIEYRSRVIITGQGLLLKRPLLKDVEITYSEIGEVNMTQARTKVRATVKIGSIHFLTVNLGFSRQGLESE
jgi:hypothetical protein